MMYKVCMVDYCTCIRLFFKEAYNDLDLARTS